MKIQNELLEKLSLDDIKDLLDNLESTLGYAKGNHDKLIRDIHGGKIEMNERVSLDVETEQEIIDLTNENIQIINLYLKELEIQAMIDR